MHKIVNGKRVELTKDEVEKTLEGWAKNSDGSVVSYSDLRKKEYPAIGDQLDAILKQMNYMQMSKQTDLIEDMDKIIGEWLAVKRRHPKE